MNSSSNTLKTIYTELISLHEYIQLKSKIKTLDTHSNLPWIVFSDLENNIMIFDVIDKKPIRAFNISQFFQEQVTVKDLKFFNINDKQYILNYELNEIKKIKGIPFQLRSSLLIITMEKYICFYSYVTQNFIKTISPADLEQKLPVKCEVFNYMYLIIQTSDGSLIIWNILDWTLVRSINKSSFNKPVSNFLVITTKTEDKFVAVANTNGNLFVIDILKKDVLIVKLDEKTEHDANVLYMDFNPFTNILSTISKNAIHLVDIRNIKNSKRIPNFSYFKSEKPYGVITNLNNNFTKNSYFIYGKTPFISAIDLTLELIKDRKLDSKDMKNYISYNFDLESQNLPKTDRAFKIYIAKFLNHTNDFLILGTNKGVAIAKFNSQNAPDIVPVSRLIDLSGDTKLTFYSISSTGTSLIETLYTPITLESKLSYNIKNNSLLPQAFDNKSLTTSFFNKFKINFSFDNSFMSLVDIINNIYTIYSLTINEELKFIPKALKYGKCSGELEWCPYDNIFAVTTSSFSQVSSKSNSSDKNRLSNYFKISFSLNLFKIENNSISTLYVIDDIPCHRLFGGHYIGIINNLITTTSSNHEDLTYPGITSNFTYIPEKNNNLVLNFYNWNEKIKLDVYISEEPKFIINSSDLSYMIIVFNDKYTLYKINFDECSTENLENSENSSKNQNFEDKNIFLSPSQIFYYKIIDAIIYENFILIFLTNRGIYFHILNEDGSYPNKLLKNSDEMNMYHIKVSKRIKEKNTIHNKKLLPIKILGIFDGNLVTSSCFNMIGLNKIENILFKIVDLIVKRKFNEIPGVLSVLEKKYIKSVMSIFKYYFDNNEEILRKIFSGGSLNGDMIEHFGLYKYEEFFLNDYLMSPIMNIEDRSKVDKCLRSILVRNISSNNLTGVNNLYQLANKCGLTFEILSSKYIDPNTFLKSMLLHNRNFESYVFNENYKINGDMGEKILSRAYERINQSKVN